MFEEESMRLRNQVILKKTACILAVLAVCLGLAALDLRAKICEEAFERCLQDPVNVPLGPLGALYCTIGYAFCKKFIDPAA
jgi:hypothetical protein